MLHGEVRDFGDRYVELCYNENFVKIFDFSFSTQKKKEESSNLESTKKTNAKNTKKKENLKKPFLEALPGYLARFEKYMENKKWLAGDNVRKKKEKRIIILKTNFFSCPLFFSLPLIK